MRIGIDARMYGSGFTGIGRYNYELIRNLSEIDKKNEYVIFLRKKEYEEFIPPNERFTKVLADFPHYSIAEQTKFLKVLNQCKIDLMHFTHFNAPLFYNKPYIVTIHDLTLSFFPGKKMNNFIRRFCYKIVLKNVIKKAKRIIAVSKNTKKDLEEIFHADSDHIQIIYNGVNPEFSEKPIMSKSELMDKFKIKKPYFLYTGVWRDHKNLTGLIKAFAELNNECQNQYNLVITGRPNANYPEVENTIKELHLADSVNLSGLVSEDELKAFYHYALSYVFPSFYEGFGLPLLEAMQCGIPVVASDKSAIPEICGEGNALFFDPYNIDDIKEKMKIIASNESLRQKLVKNGFERVRFFNWKKMAEKVLEIYNTSR